ncbi:hypothetical protein H5410_047877 [Solanum commersonii]|uniref:Disease resistance protein Roq1-like winged-helix domain-containing protein n=1 Tax=Solanum commersonii TaxID=4109 RepID=A0A9J5XGG1_SOLCO|nr:hypothetical protein H5410_047877 [Solanum commersonii]
MDLIVIIVCAFHGFFEDEVTKILNVCGFYSESAITTLLQRNLLQRNWHYLVMHDLVQDMGREIVRMESPRDYGKWSRLFKPQEVRDVLQGNKVRFQKCGSIGGRRTNIKGCELEHQSISEDDKSKELRWLSWKECPLKCILSNFLAKKHNCSNLKEIQPSIGKLHRLTGLSLYCCKKITDLPSSTCQLKSLEYLDISYCSSLQTLPADIGDMQSLRHPHESVEMLRSPNLEAKRRSFRRTFHRIESLQIFISILSLSYCGLYKVDIPRDIGSLYNLTVQDLSGNNFFSDLFALDNLTSIQKIDIINCTFLQIPFDKGFFSAPALSNPSRKYPQYEEWFSGLFVTLKFCPILDTSLFVVSNNKVLVFEWTRYMKIFKLHGEVSCAYYISNSNDRPFNGLKIKGREKITVEEGPDKGRVKKIGIHLLYLDKHGNVTSLPAK